MPAQLHPAGYATGWRPEDRDLEGGIKVYLLAGICRRIGDVLPLHQSSEPLIDQRGIIFPVVYGLLHRKVLQNSDQSADMIVMRMGQDQEVQAGDVLCSQILLQPGAHLRRASVDEKAFFIELEQDAVPLAYVNEMGRKVLRGHSWRD